MVVLQRAAAGVAELGSLTCQFWVPPQGTYITLRAGSKTVRHLLFFFFFFCLQAAADETLGGAPAAG
jgi:hypothetical protein